jgi:hypothetical protein
MGDQRLWRYAYAYSEYAAACAEEGERAYAFSTFCRGLREWRASMEASEAPEWFPGEYLRTHWSKLKVSIDGGEAALPLFVATLAYGDATFACRADDFSTLSWMRCCERAYQWLGGVPYVTDCTQCKVSETARSTIEAFARHYRTVLYDARPKTARTAHSTAKPLDAKSSPYVVRMLARSLDGLDAASLADVDALIAEGVRLYNSVVPEGRPSRQSVLFERERPQMLALPDEGADFATWSTRKVADDYHFTVSGVRYSVPWRHALETVRVCWTQEEVRAYSGGELIAVHERMREPIGRCTVTDPAHRPPAHRWFANRMDERFLLLAEEAGPNVARAMGRVLAACKRGNDGFRPCKELLDLSGEPSDKTLDEACCEAISRGGELSVDLVRTIMFGGAT